MPVNDEAQTKHAGDNRVARPACLGILENTWQEYPWVTSSSALIAVPQRLKLRLGMLRGGSMPVRVQLLNYIHQHNSGTNMMPGNGGQVAVLRWPNSQPRLM